MIRTYQNKDLDQLMVLWQEANTDAHNFIDASYWESMHETVREILPSAEIYVYEEDETILGFIGLMDTLIAGIFIRSNQRSKGIGRSLLNQVKTKKTDLVLQVYEKNQGAFSFYQREGFKVVNRSVDTETNEVEVNMKWCRD